MDRIFESKAALVSCGSLGLGALIAKLLAKHGADVAITYVSSTETAIAVVKELKGYGVNAVAIQSEQEEFGLTSLLADKAINELGKLDIYVSKAGIAYSTYAYTHVRRK